MLQLSPAFLNPSPIIYSLPFVPLNPFGNPGLCCIPWLSPKLMVLTQPRRCSEWRGWFPGITALSGALWLQCRGLEGSEGCHLM